MKSEPKFPSDIIGCDGECGFERRGGGWKCVEGEGCGRFIAPRETGYDEITAYYEYWNNVEIEVKRLKVRHVSSKELDQKDLRAKNYVVDEIAIANAIIQTWAHENHISGFIRMNSNVMRDLRSRVATHIRKAYERGQREG